MAGYVHEFKRDHCCTRSVDLEKLVQLGTIQQANLTDNITNDAIAKALEAVALQLPAPRKNENFMAPVNDTENRCCQEWTMDYLRLLVEKGYVNAGAIDKAQSERDPPSHGIGLRPTGAGAQ